MPPLPIKEIITEPNRTMQGKSIFISPCTVLLLQKEGEHLPPHPAYFLRSFTDSEPLSFSKYLLKTRSIYWLTERSSSSARHLISARMSELRVILTFSFNGLINCSFRLLNVLLCVIKWDCTLNSTTEATIKRKRIFLNITKHIIPSFFVVQKRSNIHVPVLLYLYHLIHPSLFGSA